MDYIGTISPKLWQTAQDVAPTILSLPEQIPNCPYIVLKQINQKQLLALSGLFSRQHIDLYIFEICAPNISPKERVPISPTDYDKAQTTAQELLSHAVTTLSDTSSTDNQPNTNKT